MVYHVTSEVGESIPEANGTTVRKINGSRLERKEGPRVRLGGNKIDLRLLPNMDSI